MKPNLLLFLSIIATIFISCNQKAEEASKDSEETGDVVKIGAIFPLTGAYAYIGQDNLDAMKLALKEAQPTKYQYKIIADDSVFDVKKALFAVQKQISLDKVNMVIPFGSPEASAINSTINEKKVMSLSLGAADDKALVGEYGYSMFPSVKQESQVLAKYLAQKGYKNVAILTATSPFANAATEALTEYLKEEGVIFSTEQVQPDLRDFRNTILKVTATKPDMVVLLLLTPQLELAYKRLREVDVSVPVSSVELFERSSQKELFEGQPFSTASLAPKEMMDRFKAEYGREPDGTIIYGYDLMQFIMAIQEKEDHIIKASEWPEVIKKQGNLWQSPNFGTVEINEEGRFLSTPEMKVFQNGVAVTL